VLDGVGLVLDGVGLVLGGVGLVLNGVGSKDNLSKNDSIWQRGPICEEGQVWGNAAVSGTISSSI